jgi:hypothetical protein
MIRDTICLDMLLWNIINTWSPAITSYNEDWYFDIGFASLGKINISLFFL